MSHGITITFHEGNYASVNSRRTAVELKMEDGVGCVREEEGRKEEGVDDRGGNKRE